VAEQNTSGAVGSAGTTLRGLVMFLCLIALPLAALRGTKWEDVTGALPSLAKRLLDMRWGPKSAPDREGEPQTSLVCENASVQSPRRLSDSQSSQDPAADRSIAPAKPAEAKAGGRAVRDTPDTLPAPPSESLVDHRVATGDERLAASAPDRAVASSAGQLRDADAPGALLGPGAQPGQVRQASLERVLPDAPRRPAGQREITNLNRTSLVPVSRRERDAPAMRPIRPFPARIADVDAGDTSPTAAAGDRFIYVLDRLRELGAAYYLLEAWGSEAQRFRFHCKMVIGGNPGYTRQFEANDPDPLQAMARVLSDVEAWRAGP
jgi:hypothetical protein